jgi:putative spermidine/putrescine transport system permease protein
MAMGLGLIDAPTDFPAMVHDQLSLGVIIAHLLFAVPYFTLLFGQIYKDAHVARLENLTQTLGGNRLQCLTRVTLPILIDKAGTQLLLLFITVFGSYEIPLLLGRQAPQMISVLTLRKYQMFDILQKPEAFIAALLYTVFVSALLVIAFRKGRMFRDV